MFGKVQANVGGVKTKKEARMDLKERRRKAKALKKSKGASQVTMFFRMLQEALEQIKITTVKKEVEVEYVKEGEESKENPKTFIEKEEVVDYEATVKLHRAIAETALNTIANIEALQ